MTAQEKLSEPKFAELVTSAIVAYENQGGPYLEAVHRHQAEKCGYNKEEVGQLWLDAMERVKLARAEKSNLAKTEPKQVEVKVEPTKVEGPNYRRIVPTAGTLYLPTKKAPVAEIAKRAERQIKPIDGAVKRRAMLRFNPAKNPFNQNGFENARIALDLMEFDCALDLFHHKPIIRGKHAWLGGDGFEDLDNVALKLRQLILDEFNFDPKEKGVFDALRARCLDHAFDPLLDYLDVLEWDGKPRLDRWLANYCRADDTPLNRAFGRKTLIAAVRRARHPGCKFDYLLVLEGDQGIGKSTVVKILAGDDYYSDKAIIGCDTREQQESIQGVWFYEIAELQGLSKVDMNWMKMFLSRTHDKARPAFGRSVVDRPRRGIMIGTTNDDAYLRDTTGNRRWWPVKLHGRIDLAGLQRDRDQLLAEAVVGEATDESLVIPERLWGAAAIEQAARMEVDAWLEPIGDHLCKLEAKRANIEGSFSSKDADKNCAPEFRVSTAYLLGDVLCIEESRRGQRESKRLADVMRTLGWRLAQHPIKVGKKTCRAYTKPQPES
jgi:putative DNA primase/helicase